MFQANNFILSYRSDFKFSSSREQPKWESRFDWNPTFFTRRCCKKLMFDVPKTNLLHVDMVSENVNLDLWSQRVVQSQLELQMVGRREPPWRCLWLERREAKRGGDFKPSHTTFTLLGSCLVAFFQSRFLSPTFLFRNFYNLFLYLFKKTQSLMRFFFPLQSTRIKDVFIILLKT